MKVTSVAAVAAADGSATAAAALICAAVVTLPAAGTAAVALARAPCPLGGLTDVAVSAAWVAPPVTTTPVHASHTELVRASRACMTSPDAGRYAVCVGFSIKAYGLA